MHVTGPDGTDSICGDELEFNDGNQPGQFRLRFDLAKVGAITCVCVCVCVCVVLCVPCLCACRVRVCVLCCACRVCARPV